MFVSTGMCRVWNQCRKKRGVVKAVLVCVCVLMAAEPGGCGNYRGLKNKSPEAVRNGMQNMEIHIADKVSYTVKAAKTAEELRTGLMNVRSLSDNAGMLFDLRQYPGASMWMKNTYIPLDMLFIGCDWKVVDIYENAKPLSLRRIGSSKPFCYVLEINGGNASAAGIATGDGVMPDRPI